VPVDRESEERINALDLETLLPSEARRPPVIDSPTVPGRRILKHVQGHCCFLSLQKKCLIHQRHDKETKPQACQDFPFRYIETPAGDFAGLTFACTAVLEERGPYVEEQREELEANRHRSISRRTISLPVHLADRIPITWEQYEGIEKDLHDILEIETQPVESRLIAQSLYLRLLEDFVREANAEGLAIPESGPKKDEKNEEMAEVGSEGSGVEESNGPLAESAATGTASPNRGVAQSNPPARATLEGVLPSLILTDEMLDTFRRQMGKDAWTRLFGMAFKRLEQPLLLRSFLGQIIAFRQTLVTAKRSRIAAIALIFGTYIRQAFRMGGLFLNPLPRVVEWKEIRKIQIDFADPYFAYTVKRFYQHALFRKDLLLEANLRLAHGFMLMYFGLWRYYIAALTAVEGLEKAERRHLLEGLFNVEQFYVFHSSFNTLFSRYPTWRASVESVMNAPGYPASMTRAEL